jgi:hypothetical protein
VGVKPMREFLGALTDAGIQKGILSALCGYSGEAKQLAEKHGIENVNEVGLAKMIDCTGAQFEPEAQTILADTRKFCPKCEAEMVLRTAKWGWGLWPSVLGVFGVPKVPVHDADFVNKVRRPTSAILCSGNQGRMQPAWSNSDRPGCFGPVLPAKCSGDSVNILNQVRGAPLT